MAELTKDEYLAKSRALQTGFGPTTDFADPHIGATVQSEGGIPTSASELPGQVFSVDQLPDPAAAVAYGLPPQTVPAHLILDDAENATKHVQGKDALDVINAELRQELGDPALAFDNTVRTREDALTSLTDRTGAGLGEGGEDTTADNVAVDGVIGGDGVVATPDAGATGPVDPEGVQKEGTAGKEAGHPHSRRKAGEGDKAE